ncbi:MAG: hypothetical protein IJG63_03235 [Oscillospiraceae bacterium]|nr:hypothetical protein [Oscillospiraceae bacterium]
MIIEVLYPEICNLYGDLFNAKYLQLADDSIRLHNTRLKDEPLFMTEEPALIYMGGTTEDGQELAAEALRPYMPRVKELVERSVPFLVTGNAMELFGRFIDKPDGGRIDGLGLFDTWSVRDMEHRYNSLWLGRMGDMVVTGFKSQFGHSYGDNSDCALFEVTKGAGLNPESRYEGLRKNNFMATYLTGPLLPLNPDFAKYMLRLIGAKDALPDEKAAREAFDIRIKELSNPELHYEY